VYRAGEVLIRAPSGRLPAHGPHTSPEAKRRNIPTAELQSLVAAEDAAPKQVGVMISALVFRGPGARRELPLDAPAFGDGFHAVESLGPRRWRWTDGAASLAIPDDLQGQGGLLLDLHVAAVQPHWQTSRSATREEPVPIAAQLWFDRAG
jgi:hypothetical protein